MDGLPSMRRGDRRGRCDITGALLFCNAILVIGVLSCLGGVRAGVPADREGGSPGTTPCLPWCVPDRHAWSRGVRAESFTSQTGRR
jgi:hypothetical protein